MAASPIFIGTAKAWMARASTAANFADASTTTGLVLMVTSAATGTRIDRLVAKHAPANDTSATTVGLVRWFINRSGTYRLIEERIMPAATRSVSAIGGSVEISRTDGLPVILLESGDLLYVGTTIAQAVDFSGFGGDY